ncbi:MAG: hypothetical protein FD123_2149 [Bacteroidetes bacterium]|nr:MAG: hypothetical protein FD123_2149 [Bacteroidota bacterium]
MRANLPAFSAIRPSQFGIPKEKPATIARGGRKNIFEKITSAFCSGWLLY